MVEGMIGNKKNFIFQLEQQRINNCLVQNITNAKSKVDSAMPAPLLHQDWQDSSKGSRAKSRKPQFRQMQIDDDNRRFVAKMSDIMNRRNSYMPSPRHQPLIQLR